jgi:hypothetical protein
MVPAMLLALGLPEAQTVPLGPDRPTRSFDLYSFSRSRPSQVVRIASFQYSVVARESGVHLLRGTRRVTARQEAIRLIAHPNTIRNVHPGIFRGGL